MNKRISHYHNLVEHHLQLAMVFQPLSHIIVVLEATVQHGQRAIHAQV